MPIDGNVCGLGSVRHREFAFASGEMTSAQFTDFLTTTIDAVLLAQVSTAIRGNAYAQKHYIERYDWAERERRQEIAESLAFWTAYVASQREAHAEAKRKGEPPPTQLPHPDDVLIDEKGVRIVGRWTRRDCVSLRGLCDA